MTTNLTALYGLGESSSGKWKSQTFTASGLWQRPAGVEVVKVLLVAGGGSGGTFEVSGSPGGNSSFGGVIISRGGGPGSAGTYGVSYGGPGGGVGTGFPAFMVSGGVNYTLTPDNGYQPVGVTSSNLTTVANGGDNGALGFSSAFGSTGAGGGSKGFGGNVIGFGSGGFGQIGYYSYAAGGGGASYGNGGNGYMPIRNNALRTWSNPNFGTPGIFGAGGGANWGGGGGGGEIVYREIPVEADQIVVIGSGGSSKTTTRNFERTTNLTLTSGAGGNGLCIVFWQE